MRKLVFKNSKKVAELQFKALFLQNIDRTLFNVSTIIKMKMSHKVSIISPQSAKTQNLTRNLSTRDGTDGLQIQMCTILTGTALGN